MSLIAPMMVMVFRHMKVTFKSWQLSYGLADCKLPWWREKTFTCEQLAQSTGGTVRDGVQRRW